MSLPDYQPTRLAEGEYRFIITDYEKKKHDGGAVTVKFTFKVETSRGGYRQHVESIAVWKEYYRDLVLAIGGTEDEDGIPHLSETAEVIGSSFKARIIHEKDKDDPEKSWARISNIHVPEVEALAPEEEDVPPPINGVNGEKDDLPF